MATGDVLKRIAVIAIAMLAVSAADAQQRKRLPSRTEPIPDTETGRPAASAEPPPNPSMMIYGPPVTPLGAPPEEAKPAPVAAPKPSPPPEPVATPAPPPKPEPVAIPAPAPGPEPVAVPKPQPVPPPVVRPVPETPQPVAVPAPAPKPAPIVAVPERKPAPIVAPQPVVKPVPERREVVATVRPSAPAAAKLDDKFVERIFACLSPGLPSDWRRAWIVVTNVGAAGARKLESKFFYTTSRRDEDAESLVPCSAQDITDRIAGLPAQRPDWRSAKLLIDSEGEFDLKYEY